MEILRIEPANRIYYEDLMPAEMLSLLYREELTPFGLIKETPEGAEAVGLLILREEEESFDIHWLAVAEEYRGAGYGDSLLQIAFRLAEKYQKKVRFLAKKLTREGQTETPTEGYTLEGYLFDRGFFPATEEEGEVLVYLEEMKKKTLMQNSKPNPSIKPFSKFSEELMKIERQRIREHFGSEAADSLDLETSLAFLENGKLRCTLPVRKVKFTYYPLELSEKDQNVTEEIRKALISAVLAEAFALAEGEGMVSLCLKEGNLLSEFISFVAVRTRIDTRVYEAPYDALAQEEQRYLKEQESREEMEQNREKIPEKLFVTGVEYFSGVGE